MSVYYEEYIPPILKGTKEFSALSLSVDDIGDRIWEDIGSIWNNQFIETLDEDGCARWERILNLTPLSVTSIEERRFNILSKVNESLPYDLKTFENMLQALVGKNYRITVNYQDYTVRIALQPSFEWRVDSVRNLCVRVLPANLVYAVVVNYATWELLENYTWGELETLTWDDVSHLEE